MNFLTNLLTAAANNSGLKLDVAPGNFVENLKYMGIGMLVIFVVIGIIILTTTLINWLFSKK